MEGTHTEKSAKPRGTGKRQMDLVKTDDQIEEIENAASNYVEIRNQRMALTEDEVTANEKLVAVMKTHKKTRYTVPRRR